ncbi:hypothetical protein [Citrifermentans bremense]|nr:hypothetical protein [Citrifermentans bremense]
MYGTVRMVVWEDGGGDPASYPIVPVAKVIFQFIDQREFLN